MADFRFVGVYRIIPTRTSIITAARYHNYDWLINNHGEFAEDIQWGKFKNLGLLEFQVFGKYSGNDLINISQNDQSPYMEFYLDSTGTQSIGEKDAIAIEGRRVCFFLHFVDPSKPLQIGDQRIELPEMSDLPERLTPFAHYVPVD
jgi:hypothetical protein